MAKIDQTLSLKLRAKQEEISQILNDGYYKSFIEMQAKMFDAYVSHGFTREEALEILLVMVQNNKWNLEPNFCQGAQDEDTSEESQIGF